MITKMSRSSMNTKTWYRSMLAGNDPFSPGAYELIETNILTTTATSITFSSIPQTYKHLQLRMTTRLTSSSGFNPMRIRFNATSPSTYIMHFLEGNGSTVSSGNFLAITDGIRQQGMMSGSSNATGVFGVAITDILDYASTSKNTTIRTLAGGINAADTTARITLNSGAWIDTAAISEIRIAENAGATIAIGSRFSLYGIKG